MTTACIRTTSVRSASDSLELLAVADLARLLKVSTRTIWTWHSAGRLPSPVKVGRIVRWRAADVDAWLAAGCPRRA